VNVVVSSTEDRDVAQREGRAPSLPPGRKLRVLHVIDGLGHGGAETVMLNELRLVDRDRFAMYVVSVSDDHHPAGLARARSVSEGAEIISGRALWDPRPVLRLVAMIRREHIDVVHTHLEGADVVGGAAARLARRPLVSTLHIVHEWRANLRRGRQVLADAAARWLPQRFIAVSEPVKESHVRRLHLDPATIEVLPNVSLADRSLPDDFDRDAVRSTFAPDGSVLLCTVANLIANKKDVPSLIRALPAVRDALAREVTLLVVGDGPQRSELEALAGSLGVADVVRFLGYRDDAIQILASSDVLCHATLFEGMPMVVLEAMALGLPVVATRAPGVTEVIDDGRTGLLVPPRDPAALAAAILRVLAHDDLRERLVSAARTEIASTHNTEAWVARIEAIYEDLARSRRLGA
jgi:glycosyltransferase involved in cell wall biosynthesis